MHTALPERIGWIISYMEDCPLKIDLTCPIEIRGYELICDDRGCVRAYITLNNLAPHAIAHFDAIVCWANSITGQSEAQPIRADQLSADARATFQFSLSTTTVAEADVLELHFTRVHFADGEPEWIGGQAEPVEIDELPQTPGAELRLLHNAAGEDAVRFPEKHEKHWVCVCGRANFRHQTVCARCLRERADVLRNLNRNVVVNGATPPERRPEPARRSRISEEFARELQELFPLFRRQREVLIRRTITMSVIIALLLGVSAINNHQLRIEEARRGAIPPTLSVHVDQP